MLLVFFTTIASYAQITKVEIMATGLTCSMCSNAINKQLKTLPEVERVSTDLNTNTFTVHLKKENQITPLILKQKVEKAGFFVGSMIVTLTLNHSKWENSVAITPEGSTYVFLDQKTNPGKEEVAVKVMDKGFITPKEYKKTAKALSKYPTYAAGDAKTFHVKMM